MSFKKEALLYQKIDREEILCLTCQRKCRIASNKLGFCRTRKNIGGKLYTLVYGDIFSISANPIEKKPFFHFYPGTKALTVGSWSCNFTCPWCQNYDISKYPENIGKGEYISPEKFIRLLETYKCQGTSISFNEPTLLLEYSIDVFKLAREKGYYNTYVTNGYMTADALKLLIESGLNAMNIDIKGDKNTVKKYCNANVEEVWRNVIEARKYGAWIELTTLVVNSINDSKRQLKKIAQRIKKEVGDDVPWHVTRFYPAYKFMNEHYIPLTPGKTLERAVEIGKEFGLKYVYIGNIPGHRYENTYCPNCNELLIERYGFDIIKNILLASNKCPVCNYQINIINK